VRVLHIVLNAHRVFAEMHFSDALASIAL